MLQSSGRLGLVIVGFVIGAIALVGCGGGGASTPAKGDVALGNPQQGQQAITRYGCGACHVIPGVQGANGQVGPSLAGIGGRRTLAAGTMENTPANMVKWIQDPQEIKPGSQMPDLNVTDSDARDIAAYLYTLK